MGGRKKPPAHGPWEEPPGGDDDFKADGLSIRQSLLLDRRALLDSRFGLTPEKLEEIGNRAFRIATSKTTRDRDKLIAMRVLMSMMQLMQDEQHKAEGRIDTVIQINNQQVDARAFVQQIQAELTAMDGTIPLPPPEQAEGDTDAEPNREKTHENDGRHKGNGHGKPPHEHS